MGVEKAGRSALTIINQASRIASIFGVVFLSAMMGLTVADVIMRYFFNRPILGSVEMCEYLMVGAGFFGIAWCAVKRGHVQVDLVVSRFSPRIQSGFEVATLILSLTVVPMIAWQNFSQAVYVKVERVESDLLEIPAYPFYLIVAIAFTLLTLVMITLLMDSIRKVTKR